MVTEEIDNLRGTGAVQDDLRGADVLFDQAQSTHDGGHAGDGRAVLVVVEYGDFQFLLQFVFNVVAFRRLDVFQVDAGVVALQGLDDGDELILVRLVDADGHGVDGAEAFEQGGFAFHDRHGGAGADFAEAQDTGTVRADGHHVAAAGQVEGAVRLFLDGQAGSRYARRVGDGQVVVVIQGHFAVRFDLTVVFDVQLHRFFA